MPTEQERFRGCLLGLAVGDSLGSAFEGEPGSFIRARYPSPAAIFARARQDTFYYTDDTQMTIGVAEALLQDGAIVEKTLCEKFVSNYVPARGYGRGARRIIEAMEEGRDHAAVAEQVFPGGSFGNGAAMRVAPIGLLFARSPARLKEQVVAQSQVTHRHPLGVNGALLIATAVAKALQADTVDKQGWIDELRGVAEPELAAKLARVLHITSAEIGELGNGITAQESVVTAIACFLAWPTSFVDAVGNAILLGGDTDTIAAITGAVSGAYLGIEGIPAYAIQALENEQKGCDYLLFLADRLFQCSQSNS
jgi:poly(ADP-ribose) glycohydrolase ARH3